MNPLRIILVFVFSLLTCAQEPEGVVVSPTQQAPPHRAQNLASAFADSGLRFPQWRHGLISIQRRSSTGAITVFGSDGHSRRDIEIGVPGSVLVKLSAATIAPSGRIYVSGGSQDKDGRIANFIAVVTNATISMVRTNPFVPRDLCSSGDSLWVFGWERSAERWDKDAAEYFMLRQYSEDGREVKALVSRSLVQARTVGGDPSGMGLRCTRDNIYLMLTGARKLFIVDPKTDGLAVWDLPPLEKSRQMTGFSVTESGELFASILDFNNKATTIYKLQLVKSTAEWVPFGEAAAGTSMIIGSNDDELVVVQMGTYQTTWKPTNKGAR